MHKINIFFVLLIFSCTSQNENLIRPVELYEQSNLCSQYQGYSTQIMHGQNMRMVAINSSKFITFTREFGNLKIVENKNFDEGQLKTFLMSMESLKLVGYASGDNYCVFYSKVSDSSYIDLRKHNQRFFDKTAVKHPDCINEDCPYLLNFIHASDKKYIPKSIRNLYSVHKIKGQWYYFRSFEYSQYARF